MTSFMLLAATSFASDFKTKDVEKTEVKKEIVSKKVLFDEGARCGTQIPFSYPCGNGRIVFLGTIDVTFDCRSGGNVQVSFTPSGNTCGGTVEELFVD